MERGATQIIIASNSTAAIPTIRNANAATSWGEGVDLLEKGLGCTLPE